MLKSFISGTVLLAIICTLSIITGDWSYIYKISGIIALISLGGCGLLVGAFEAVV